MAKSFLTFEELYRKISKGLKQEISIQELEAAIENNSRKMIVLSDGRVYLSSVYYMKQKCLEILSQKNIPSLIEFNKLPQQLMSILQWKYSILTGQAGTGKTTLIKQLKNSSFNVKFTATIGKTAKNLDESATTIHDLLGYPKFQVKEIDADIVVIDESSMLTWQLLYHTLTKIKGHIIFVGDPEQTSPVQGSEIFKEMIKIMPEGSVKRLETVYRTINTKREIIKITDRESAISKILSLAIYFEKKGYNWQILTPLKRIAYDINNKIQFSAKIVAVADVYDALRNNRPYRSACDHDLAITYLKGKNGMFDEKIIKVLEEVIHENSDIWNQNQRRYNNCFVRGC